MYSLAAGLLKADFRPRGGEQHRGCEHGSQVGEGGEEKQVDQRTSTPRRAVVEEELNSETQAPEQGQESAQAAAERRAAGQIARKGEAQGRAAEHDHHDVDAVHDEDLAHDRREARQVLAVAKHARGKEIGRRDEELRQGGRSDADFESVHRRVSIPISGHTTPSRKAG